MRLHAVYDRARLAGAALAGSEPVPLVAVRERADVARAQQVLYRSIRKSMDQDGVVAFYVFRVLSRLMTRALIDTPVTPNQVSLSAMALGLLAAVCAGLGTEVGLIAAGVLFWLGAVVDCVDGEIARLRVKGSKLGEWLDSMADEVSTFGLLIGLGIGMERMDYDAIWTTLATLGAGVGMLVNLKLYVDLHRWRAPIDTAQYPWFFGQPASAPEPTGWWPHFVRWLGFCFRRDAFVTAVAIMLVADVPHWAVALLAGGAGFMVLVLATHVTVTAARGDSSPG
jgi:hypothetical protein